MSERQPIETAPRDVEACLLWCSDRTFGRRNTTVGPRGLTLGRITDGTPYGDGMNGNWTFTHWMPEPDAPL